MAKRRYRTIEMPPRFVLEVLTATGEWIDWGLYEADSFMVGHDGSYLSEGEGSPTHLRWLRQDGDVIYVVDGGGDPYVYRLVAFPSDCYQPSEDD
jgi:hypothetical protein